jgi:hypothetical protein
VFQARACIDSVISRGPIVEQLVELLYIHRNSSIDAFCMIRRTMRIGYRKAILGAIEFRVTVYGRDLF